MTRPLGRWSMGIVVGMTALLFAMTAYAVEITPFRTGNMSPVTQIFGIPAAGDAHILDSGSGEVTLTADAANSFGLSEDLPKESVTLDGETYRLALALRYGLGKGIEGGIEVPFVAQSGGVFDGFIQGFHRAFNLENGRRTEVPRNRLLYLYQRDGQDKLHYEDSGMGIGDLRLQAGIRLYDDGASAPRRAALRAELKLPTGNSDRLRGSGSVDFSLWLTGSDDYGLGEWGHLTIFGGGGGTVMSRGDVLPDQQRTLAGFGMLGFGWSPVEWFAFKAQATFQTSIYQASTLPEIGEAALIGIAGFTFALTKNTTLDIGITEDMILSAAPDVAFHLALSQRF
ncbi:MAG: DUF3187 family protein [Desulfuromonadales bacterium]|nr:MAG: DUF3187 family protein [Desulfuromonadales bacterium]